MRELWKNTLENTQIKYKCNEKSIKYQKIDLGVFQGSSCSPQQFQIYANYVNKKLIYWKRELKSSLLN